MQAAERLLLEGTQAADPVQGTLHLRAALALWRGQPLLELAGLPWLEEQAGRLDLLWLQIKRALVQARLRAGEHAALLPDLERLAAEHPLDEQLHAQLMLALYRSSRQADALAACRQLGDTLREELGIGPSRMISDLQTAILRQDPALDPPALAVTQATTGPGMPVPAQLPPSVPAFAGRLAELVFGLSGAPEVEADGIFRIGFDDPALDWRLADGDAEIAPGVTAVLTAGHTPGHQSFVVDLDPSAGGHGPRGGHMGAEPGGWRLTLAEGGGTRTATPTQFVLIRAGFR